MSKSPTAARRRRHASAIAAVTLAVTAGLSGCGGADEGGDEVASLGTDVTSAPDGTAGDDSGEDVDREDAMLAFAECMRDHGVDMPDPVISSDGGAAVQIVEDEVMGDVSREEHDAAQEACNPILEDAVGEIEIDPEQQAEMREEMLEYAECMREHGIDFPDPVFDDRGGVSVEIGEAGSPDDEQLRDANEACAQDGGPIMAAPPIAAGSDG